LIDEILGLLYLLIPAYFANMAPVFFKRLDFLNYPIDFGKKIRKKRIFGKNKTFRGLFFGMILAMLVFYIQKIFFLEGFVSFSLIDYSLYSVWFGAVIGLVTILGDAIESFFKRQLGKKPGKPWVPFDQLDFVITNFIFFAFFIDISILSYLIAAIIITLCDMIIQYTGYKLKLKEDFL